MSMYFAFIVLVIVIVSKTVKIVPQQHAWIMER